MKYNNLLLICLLTFVSCKHEKKNNVEENTYKILYLLYDDITEFHIKYTAFPARPPNPEISWDSIKKIMVEDQKIEKDTIKIINELLNKNGKLIVAISRNLFVPSLEDFNEERIKEYLLEYKEVFERFKNFKTPTEIDVSKIANNKYSYILPYQDYYKKTYSKGFDKYDMILNFSRIAFNTNYDKAIVIIGISLGKLNGLSVMCFLEKKKEKWYIKHEKGLSIS